MVNTLVPLQGQKNVDLTVTAQAANCSGTAAFTNIVNTRILASAQVAKITSPVLLSNDPDYA